MSAPMITPINRVNIRDDVYVLLRSDILRQRYPPGHRFDLDELSQQLQVSRTPVKEALHRLESEGLIQIVPRKGTFVTSIDPKNVAESYDVRLALELFIAPSVVEQITQSAIEDLRAIYQQMRSLLYAEDADDVIERYTDLDQTFHVQIVQVSGNDRLSDVYRTIGGPLQMARLYTGFDIQTYRIVTDPEHEAILCAIEARAVDDLRHALENHIRRAKERVLTLITHNLAHAV